MRRFRTFASGRSKTRGAVVFAYTDVVKNCLEACVVFRRSQMYAYSSEVCVLNKGTAALHS